MSIPTSKPPDGTAPSGEVTPAQLAAAWKKRGGFDSLRKQLLADFLAAPEKDKFLSDLDVSLPALLASTPSIARQDRKDRPAAVIRSMKQVETLKPQTKALEKRLRSDDGLSRRIQAELRRSLFDLKGVPYIEEPQMEAPSAASVQAGALTALETNGGEARQKHASGSNDSVNGNGPLPSTAGEPTNAPESSQPAATRSEATTKASELPKEEPGTATGGAPSTVQDSEPSLQITMDVDVKPEPEEAPVETPSAPSARDEDTDVDMKPAVPAPSSS